MIVAVIAPIRKGLESKLMSAELQRPIYSHEIHVKRTVKLVFGEMLRVGMSELEIGCMIIGAITAWALGNTDHLDYRYGDSHIYDIGQSKRSIVHDMQIECGFMNEQENEGSPSGSI